MAKILLVEDDHVLSRMYQTMLVNAGYSVSIGRDGEEGLKMALEGHPNLILLDILMPKMDGITMLKTLRKDKWGEGVPVIILTNLDTNDETLKDVLSEHPSYYFLKSNIDRELVLDKIKQMLADTNKV